MPRKPKTAAKSKPTAVADALHVRLTADTTRVPPIPPQNFLSTGCTQLNVAISGRHNHGVPKGTYLYIVGDSGSAKTWFTFNLFAEAARNPNFTEYRFIHDNVENGALMDVGHFFGAGVLARLEPPMGTVDAPEYSKTAQQFYMNLAMAVRAGPCIYVLDSMDGLEDEADTEKFAAELHYYETGRGEGDIPGSMGMAKAKTNSKNINRVAQLLATNGSILVVISQTRDAVGSRIPGMKTRGGGRALKFYAHIELWTSVRAPITKTYLRKEREIGSTIKIDIQKNRVSGWEGKIEIPFLKGFGVDDVGGCVEYLIDERHWTAPPKTDGGTRGKRAVRDVDDESESGGKTIHAPEFEFTGTKEQLVKHISDAGDEWELQKIVAAVWNDIIDGARPPRKPRYT